MTITLDTYENLFNDKVRVRIKIVYRIRSGSKRLYRAMSEQELKAVQETGMLKSGSENILYGLIF